MDYWLDTHTLYMLMATAMTGLEPTYIRWKEVFNLELSLLSRLDLVVDIRKYTACQ